MIDITTIEDFLFSSSTSHGKNTEIYKATSIVDQLHSSIKWLNRQASKEKSPQKKADLLKEITAAERELVPLKAAIAKAKNVT